jgi:hypothetical protein
VLAYFGPRAVAISLTVDTGVISTPDSETGNEPDYKRNGDLTPIEFSMAGPA